MLLEAFLAVREAQMESGMGAEVCDYLRIYISLSSLQSGGERGSSSRNGIHCSAKKRSY